MLSIGFHLPTNKGFLPAKLQLGPFILAHVRSIHPLLPQSVYSLVDTRERDFSTQKPQLLSCNLIGPYANEIYVLKGINYFTNQDHDCAVKDVNDPHLSNILNTVSNVLNSTVLLLDGDEDTGFQIEGAFELDALKNN